MGQNKILAPLWPGDWMQRIKNIAFIPFKVYYTSGVKTMANHVKK